MCRIFFLATIIGLSCTFLNSCSKAPTKWQKHEEEVMIRDFCQQGGAFDRGFNDGKRGTEMNLLPIKQLCQTNTQQAINSYSQGYGQGLRFLNTPNPRTQTTGPQYQCQLKIFEDQYQALAPQRQQAIAKVIEQCREAREDHFFCSGETINCTLL